MKVEVLVLRVLAIVCLMANAGAAVKARSLLESMQDKTVEEYDRAVTPYLRVMGISSVLMGACLILLIVFR